MPVGPMVELQFVEVNMTRMSNRFVNSHIRVGELWVKHPRFKNVISQQVRFLNDPEVPAICFWMHCHRIVVPRFPKG
jgi:hypothetical protein